MERRMNRDAFVAGARIVVAHPIGMADAGLGKPDVPAGDRRFATPEEPHAAGTVASADQWV